MLATSTLPDELAAAGWRLTDAGKGERRIPGSIEERFVLGAERALVLMTEGATKTVALVQRHTGIVQVKRYSFPLTCRSILAMSSPPFGELLGLCA